MPQQVESLVSSPSALIDGGLSAWQDLIHSGRLHADERWISLRLEQIACHVLIKVRPCDERIETRAHVCLTVESEVPATPNQVSSLAVRLIQ